MNLKKTLSTIKEFTSLKRKLNSSKPSIAVWFVVSKLNCDDIENFVRLGIKLRVDVINFRMVQGSRCEILLPTLPNDYFGKIKRKFSSIKIRLMFSSQSLEKLSDSKNEGKAGCEVPFHEMVVFADGRVSPCCNFIGVYDSNFVENIANKSLAEIWNGKIFNMFRKGEALTHKVCQMCSFDMEFMNSIYKKEK